MDKILAESVVRRTRVALLKLACASSLVALPLAAACGASSSGDGSTTAAQSELALPNNCDQPGLTNAQISACLTKLAQTMTCHTYVADPHDGGPFYECNDFTNTYCDTAHANDIACAGLQVLCDNPNDAGFYPGHAIAVVYIGGKCVAVEPQPPGRVIGTPWLPENGSCNTFTQGIGDAICQEVGFDGGAKCVDLHHDDPVPHDGHVPACKPIQAAPAAATP